MKCDSEIYRLLNSTHPVLRFVVVLRRQVALQVLLVLEALPAPVPRTTDQQIMRKKFHFQ